MARHKLGGIVHEGAQHGAVRLRRIVLQGNVEPHVNAAVPKVTERLAGDAVALHHLVELPQVRAQVRGRHGRVLPAGPALRTVGTAAGEPGAVRTDRPQPRRLHRVPDDAIRPRAGVGRERGHGRLDLVGGVGTHLHEQPARAVGKVRHAVIALGPRDALHQPRVQALDRLGLVGEHRDHGIGRRRHVGVGEHAHEACLGHIHQLDRGLEDGRERPLGTGQEARQVGAVLGQQVLQAVARHLAAEAPELGADQAEVGGHELVEPGHGGGATRARGEASAGGGATRARGEASAGAVHHL